MFETLKEVDGIEETMLDRLAALGIVSVFDVEEVGEEVLIGELESPEELARLVVEAASARAKIVAADQAREKIEAEKRRKEEEEATRRLMAGEVSTGEMDADLAAAAILGAGGPSVPSGTTESREDLHNTPHDDERADAILSGKTPPEPAEAPSHEEPDAGFDPEGDAISPPGDTSEDDAEEITGAAISESIDQTSRHES